MPGVNRETNKNTVSTKKTNNTLVAKAWFQEIGKLLINQIMFALLPQIRFLHFKTMTLTLRSQEISHTNIIFARAHVLWFISETITHIHTLTLSLHSLAKPSGTQWATGFLTCNLTDFEGCQQTGRPCWLNNLGAWWRWTCGEKLRFIVMGAFLARLSMNVNCSLTHEKIGSRKQHSVAEHNDVKSGISGQRMYKSSIWKILSN